jgi:hypothetical protein
MSEGELSLKIEYLERGREDELRARKYTHNMIEDMGMRLNALQNSASRFEENLRNHSIEDQKMGEVLTRMDERQRVIERLVWIAVGGVGVIGALTTIIGGNILRLLAHG